MSQHWIVAWATGFLVGLWLAGLAIGGAFVLALGTVTGARWLEKFRSSFERLARLGLAGGPIALVIVAFRSTVNPAGGSSTAAVAGEWMSPAAVLARGVLCVAAWSVCVLLVTSRRRRTVGAAAATLIAVPVASWLAVADWIAPLAPGWFSTAYGLQLLAGCALTVVALTTIAQSDTGPTRARSGTAAVADVDLATMLLTFACLWAYLWFGQHLLDWYDHDASAALFHERRTRGAWRVLYLAVPLLAWLVPFALLLSARAKRRPSIRLVAATSAILGIAIDPASLVLPALSVQRPIFAAAIVLPVIALLAIAREGRQSRRPA